MQSEVRSEKCEVRSGASNPEGRKVGSLKRRVPAGQMRDEKVHAVVA